MAKGDSHKQNRGLTHNMTNINTDELTVGQAKELAAAFCEKTPNTLTKGIGASMISRYVVVRTYSAGVHAGVLSSREGREALLTDARRIWYWDGAASLSQLARDGVDKPDNCKFSVPVPEILLTEAIEIIPCTIHGEKSIRAVKEWTA